jgi:hypothetical protein
MNSTYAARWMAARRQRFALEGRCVVCGAAEVTLSRKLTRKRCGVCLAQQLRGT